MAIVHQEVCSQGPSSEVIHTAGPVGHITHHHHLCLCEPVDREGGNESEVGSAKSCSGRSRPSASLPTSPNPWGWQLLLLPTKSRRGPAATSPSPGSSSWHCAVWRQCLQHPDSLVGCRQQEGPHPSTKHAAQSYGPTRSPECPRSHPHASSVGVVGTNMGVGTGGRGVSAHGGELLHGERGIHRGMGMGMGRHMGVVSIHGGRHTLMKT